LSGKLGNVREFETCQGHVREKSCQGKVSQNCSLLVEYLRSTPFFSARRLALPFFHICGASKPLLFAFIV